MKVHERRGPPAERGQAILLAIVGLIVLAIGMYTSYNLSRTVYEKIQLQNAADATAYSLATQEARTFNFIAFANRAQVANYVQMMEAQSLLSQATYIEGMSAWLGDVTQCIGKWMKIWANLPGLEWLEPLGELLDEVIGRGLENTYEIAKEAIDSGLDEWTGHFIRVQTAENQALFGVATLMMLSTGTQLAGGAEHIIEANDPDAELTALSYALNALNLKTYADTFDPASLGLPEASPLFADAGSNGGAAAAQRVMSELAHATRFGSTRPRQIVAREPLDALGRIAGQLEAELEREGRGGRFLRERLEKLVDKLNTSLLHYVGTSKLLTIERAESWPDPGDTGLDRFERSALARGGAIVAKDASELPKVTHGKLENLDTFASVISTPRRGAHCRYYNKPPDYGETSRLLRLFSYREFECREEPRHRWESLIPPGGIQPYLKFAPKLESWSAERTSFNQPDVWVFLNKPPQALRLPGQNDPDFDIEQGGARASFDGGIAEEGVLDLGIGEGINVLARAQVYYHRPGAWQEPPNFFNPYWAARLAPKGAAIERLVHELGLGGTAARLIADNVWMH